MKIVKISLQLCVFQFQHMSDYTTLSSVNVLNYFYSDLTVSFIVGWKKLA